jgi:hypothetical protein
MITNPKDFYEQFQNFIEEVANQIKLIRQVQTTNKPEKGVDYFTQDDIDSIVNAVVEKMSKQAKGGETQ